MKYNIANAVKYNRIFFVLYNKIGSFIINCLKYFVKTDNNLIVFVSFGGRKFNDSPKAIYDAMIKDERFDKCRFLWAFVEPEKFELDRGEKIKIDSFLYFYYVLKARVWVTNSSVERGLRFKGKKTLNFNTWHGTPIKLMGSDIDDSNESMGGSKKNMKRSLIDIMLAQGQFEADIFSRVFKISSKKFKLIGLPRNDELFEKYEIGRLLQIKKQLGIDVSKKIILYAPTFREYVKDANRNCVMAPPLRLDYLEEQLSSQYVFLVRAHYEIVSAMKIEENSFVKNVSSYDNLNDLMQISDVLVSDYSSIFFDYSILNKPMIVYSYDYDEYADKRGMYFDIRKELKSNCVNDVELVDCLKKLDYKESSEIARRFKNKYVQYYGNATKQSLEIIYKEALS